MIHELERYFLKLNELLHQDFNIMNLSLKKSILKQIDILIKSANSLNKHISKDQNKKTGVRSVIFEEDVE